MDEITLKYFINDTVNNDDTTNNNNTSNANNNSTSENTMVGRKEAKKSEGNATRSLVEDLTTVRKLRERIGRDNKKKLEDSLKKYDVVVNIDTLRLFNEGWEIHGKQGKNVKEQEARLYTVHGGYNVGKTKIISEIGGVDLDNSQVLHTLGVSVRFPVEQTDINDNNDERKEEEEDDFLSSMTSEQSKKAQEECLIDHAGNDTPCHELLLDDQTATECFLRGLLIRISSGGIYVTAKFSKDDQHAIRSLVNEMNCTEQSKLLVIINLITATSCDHLRTAMNEFALTFKQGQLKINHQERQSEELGVDITFFETPRARYVFLVNDNEETFGKKYNKKMFTYIKQSLKMTVNPKKLSLIDQVCNYAKKNLNKFIVDWDPEKYDVVVNDGKIMPVFNGKNLDKPFDLRPLVFELGGAFRDDDDKELKGSVHGDDPKKFKLTVEVPGISKLEDIELEFSNRTVTVRVQCETPENMKDFRSNTRSFGSKVFYWKTHKSEPFEIPQTCQVSLNHGIFTLFLDRTDKTVRRLAVGSSVSKN